MVKRILVPIDGSRTAEHGLAEAIRLARELKEPPHLVVLHIVEPPLAIPDAGVGYDVVTLTQALREHGHALLERARSRCQTAGLSAEIELRDAQGRVGDTVAERARARACDLIVIGTHGRRGANRWVMGSDAEIVARHSSVPVLLVREPRSSE